jgi:hypothetical protein
LVQRFGSGHLLSAVGDDRFGAAVSDSAAAIAEYGGAACCRRLEHNAVASALKAMDHDLLMAYKCWFGGGTEIVLDAGEYRPSTDLDFFCSDADGNREMRTRAMSSSVSGIFGEGVQERRAFKADRYGIRGVVTSHRMDLRFEVVREARICLEGRPDQALGVPRLAHADRIAEKLLANADRCRVERSAYRDAIDLGMQALHRGPFPEIALAKAERAYGDDVGRKSACVLDQLSLAKESTHAALALGMERDAVIAATRALAGELLGLRPGWLPGSGRRDARTSTEV